MDEIKSRLEDSCCGRFNEDAVLVSQPNGWDLEQSFWSSKRVFRVFPRRLHEFDFATMRYRPIHKSRWFSRITKVENDFDRKQKYYVLDYE